MIEPIWRKETLYVINPILQADKDDMDQIKEYLEEEVGIIVIKVRKQKVKQCSLSHYFLSDDNTIAFEVEILRKLTP